MDDRSKVLDLASQLFDEGLFERRLAELVAIRSASQDPSLAKELRAYLSIGIEPWLQGMGFSTEIHDNPVSDGGPILFAERIEDPARPTVVIYGHGDTVLGLEDSWSDGLRPWELKRQGDRWFGRGTADNKGQHAINIFALEVVSQARGGRLGFNVKIVLEMAEERGSIGLREFVAAHAGKLTADVFIASDGPRVAPETPTIAAGTRGNYHFDLVVAPRTGAVHSGHWGGLTSDPALVLSHALASICDRNGRILIRDWLPGQGGELPSSLRDMLRNCPVDGGTDAARVEPDWGEPGMSPAEKLYAWNSFIVLALISGKPEYPMNAVAPNARASCQIRYVPHTDPEAIVPVLRRHLDDAGFPEVQILNARVGMPASATALPNPWIEWASQSLAKSLTKSVQVIPQTSGGMPGDVFVDHLSTSLVWIPHGHNGCRQHGPDEHLLVSVAREGLIAFTGLWWDLGHKPH